MADAITNRGQDADAIKFLQRMIKIDSEFEVPSTVNHTFVHISGI